jgi:hypothetical protein
MIWPPAERIPAVERDPQPGAAVLFRAAAEVQAVAAGRRRLLVRDEDVVERRGQQLPFELDLDAGNLLRQQAASRDPRQDAGHVRAPGDRRIAHAGARRGVDAEQGGSGHPVRGGEEGPVSPDRDDQTGIGKSTARPGIESVHRDRQGRDAQAGEGLQESSDCELLLARGIRYLAGKSPARTGKPVRHALAGGHRRLDHQDAGGERGIGLQGRRHGPTIEQPPDVL